jgi:hypothetical protein
LSKPALPHRDIDAFHTLHVHHFLAAELMKRNRDKLDTKLKTRGRLSCNEQIDFRLYLWSWIGFLAVTSEGFEKLRGKRTLELERPDDYIELLPKSHAIGKLTKQHGDLLREVRNDIFHPRKNALAIHRFASRETIAWAEELHEAFKDFFSGYTILCEVQYVLSHRMAESSTFGPNRPGKRRRGDPAAD